MLDQLEHLWNRFERFANKQLCRTVTRTDDAFFKHEGALVLKNLPEGVFRLPRLNWRCRHRIHAQSWHEQVLCGKLQKGCHERNKYGGETAIQSTGQLRRGVTNKNGEIMEAFPIYPTFSTFRKFWIMMVCPPPFQSDLHSKIRNGIETKNWKRQNCCKA